MEVLSGDTTRETRKDTVVFIIDRLFICMTLCADIICHTVISIMHKLFTTLNEYRIVGKFGGGKLWQRKILANLLFLNVWRGKAWRMNGLSHKVIIIRNY